MEKIYFKNSKGDRLCGILSAAGEPLAILCHGLCSSKESRTSRRLEEILNRNGISTFRFDFFGHGESDGRLEDLTISEAVDDVMNAVLFLKGRGYSKVGLFGSSFGGLATLISASRVHDLLFLALKSPVSDFRELDPELAIRDSENNAYEIAEKIGCPVLIVHGDADDVVPVEQSIKLEKLIKNCRLEIIRGADHDYSREEDFERMIKLISEFIIKTCKAPGGT